ncbi:MAG: cupin domain-containing protein, partial [Verrucomicrobiae bacterium]|nr:cupin domain-containing protein [Verrucomicrobiae bacterium]
MHMLKKVFSMWGRWISQKSARPLGLHKDPGLELIFVAKGTVEWKFEGKRVTAGPGTVTYTWPWQEHAGGMGLAMCEIYWVQ